MNRQSVLIAILVALAMFALPVHYMDAAVEGSRTRLEEEQSKLAPLRRQAAALREREEQAAARAAVLAQVRTRLIEAQPFATIEGALAAAAKQSGVSVGSLILEGPAPVADLPDVIRYQATLQVTGNRTQYLEFLRLLENHRLLIELPDANLHLQPAAVRGAPPQVSQALVLGFYAAAGKK